jgi:hypothetical protein
MILEKIFKVLGIFPVFHFWFRKYIQNSKIPRTKLKEDDPLYIPAKI